MLGNRPRNTQQSAHHRGHERMEHCIAKGGLRAETRITAGPTVMRMGLRGAMAVRRV